MGGGALPAKSAMKRAAMTAAILAVGTLMGGVVARAQDAPRQPTTPPPNATKPAGIARTEPPSPQANGARRPLTGNFVGTFNASALGRPTPSVNQRLNLDYNALPNGQVLDLRVENYYEGSYNRDPPGQLTRNINEHKFEVQATYTIPLGPVFLLSPALLHHDNFTITDSYWWAILTLSAKLPLSRTVTLTPNISAEKRLSNGGGRLFYDTATTLDYAFAPGWTLEGTYHRYENYGEADVTPTQKQEVEVGVIRQLP